MSRPFGLDPMVEVGNVPKSHCHFQVQAITKKHRKLRQRAWELTQPSFPSTNSLNSSSDA